MTDALLLLVLLWAALLIPSALRSRRVSSPHATVGGFEHAMNVLRNPARSGVGRELLVPQDAGRIVAREPTSRNGRAARPIRREDPVVAARRARFQLLLVATGLAVVFALIFRGVLWWPAAVAMVTTLGYALLLRRWKLQRDQARAVVRQLDIPSIPRTQADAIGSASNMFPAAGLAGPSMPLAREVAATGAVRVRHWED